MKKFFSYTYVRTSKQTYLQDGLITKHSAAFLDDPKFMAAYKAGEATGSWRGASIHWRVHIALWAAEIGSRLEGDFVECGVNKGGSVISVIKGIDFTKLDKRFWLYDTFEGLVDSQITPDELRRGVRATPYLPCYEEVVENFREYGDQIEIVRGMIPDTLAKSPDKVAYLHLDMNCAEPEIAALTHFWPRLSRGAMVLLDDYGWGEHIAQKEAIDAFVAPLGCHVMTLPTGQGIICKSV